jgi:hypothetical protein
LWSCGLRIFVMAAKRELPPPVWVMPIQLPPACRSRPAYTCGCSGQAPAGRWRVHRIRRGWRRQSAGRAD